LRHGSGAMIASALHCEHTGGSEHANDAGMTPAFLTFSNNSSLTPRIAAMLATCLANLYLLLCGLFIKGYQMALHLRYSSDTGNQCCVQHRSRKIKTSDQRASIEQKMASSMSNLVQHLRVLSWPQSLASSSSGLSV
jgi:hypothetical protein